MLFLNLLSIKNFCIPDTTTVIPINIYTDDQSLTFISKPGTDSRYTMLEFLINTFNKLNKKVINHGIQFQIVYKDEIINLNFCNLGSPVYSAIKYFEIHHDIFSFNVPSNHMFIMYCGEKDASVSTAGSIYNECYNFIGFRIKNLDQLEEDILREIPKIFSKVDFDDGLVGRFHNGLCEYVRECVEDNEHPVGYFQDGVHILNNNGDLESLKRRIMTNIYYNDN